MKFLKYTLQKMISIDVILEQKTNIKKKLTLCLSLLVHLKQLLE